MRGLLAVVVILLASGPATADEGESQLSLALGYATFSVPDYRPDGGAIGLQYERGITPILSLHTQLSGGVYYQDDIAYSGQATVGLTYLFDVLKYIPYATVGVGAMVIAGNSVETDVSPIAALSLGLEILHSRTFSYGPQARFETFFDQPKFFSAGLRLTWRWGFF
jgi:hypothetical protein